MKSRSWDTTLSYATLVFAKFLVKPLFVPRMHSLVPCVCQLSVPMHQVQHEDTVGMVQFNCHRGAIHVKIVQEISYSFYVF